MSNKQIDIKRMIIQEIIKEVKKELRKEVRTGVRWTANFVRKQYRKLRPAQEETKPNHKKNN